MRNIFPQKNIVTTFVIICCLYSPVSLSDGVVNRNLLRVSVAIAAMESGLVQAMAEEFEEMNPDVTIQFTSAGAFEALQKARVGLADLTITHHDAEENRLVVQGFGLYRVQVFFSNYALMGPPSAAAEISTYKDIVDVLNKLSKDEVEFFESSPRGGTYRKIRGLWTAAGLNPNWIGYENTGTSAVGAMVQAAEFDAYTMAEISTYLKHYDEFKGNLVILYSNDLSMRSMFSAVVMNKEKVPNVNQELAERFVEFLVSSEGQNSIREYNMDTFNFAILNPAAHLDSGLLTRRAEKRLLDESWNVKLLTILITGLSLLFFISLLLFVRYRRVNLKRQEIERTSTMNAKARSFAENASKAKSDFLANMSHEMRTPLTAIMGYAEIIRDESLTKDQRDEDLKIILNSGNHLLNLINDILDLSKIEAEKLEVEVIDVEVMVLLSEVQTFLKMQAKEKGLKVCINPELPLPRYIKSDPVRLKQILINLCSNALKFTEKGNININVKCDRFTETISFEVIDTGIGIASDELENIFGAFTQADTSTTRKYGGTGLGLSLSKQLANKLGGDIEVSSTLDEGSRFILTVNTGPLKDAEQVYDETQEVAIEKKDNHSDVEKTDEVVGHVLLAEDVIENQRLISFYLNKIGLHVTAVENGKLAVDAIGTKKYDLVLMDIQMPVMGGIEAIQLMREKGYTNPILALTANAMAEDRECCLKVGCNDFLVKPIEREKFIEAVGKYFSLRV